MQHAPGRSSWVRSAAGTAALIIGLLALYAWAQPQHKLQVFTVATMIAFAATAAGVMLGFIFAIPKTVTSDVGGTTGFGESFRRNTNLEQVSDWLVKVLIGAGVASIASARGAVTPLLSHVDEHLGAGGVLLFPCIIIVSSVAGFLHAYLLTGLQLPRELTHAIGGSDQQVQLTMIAYLYERPPDGYSRVIEVGSRYKSLLENDARYWRYLACAYGQKYAWERDVSHASADALAAIRRDALEAVTRAVNIDASTTAILAPLLHATSDSEENDLAAFRGDPEFERLLPPPQVPRRSTPVPTRQTALWRVGTSAAIGYLLARTLRPKKR